MVLPILLIGNRCCFLVVPPFRRYFTDPPKVTEPDGYKPVPRPDDDYDE